MRKDPTEFRERFKKWQSGEKVYEGGLPRFEEGTDPYNDSVDFISNYEGFSDTDNHTAVPDQLLIPHIQCLHVPPVRGKRLQKLSALFQYLVVGR